MIDLSFLLSALSLVFCIVILGLCRAMHKRWKKEQEEIEEKMRIIVRELQSSPSHAARARQNHRSAPSASPHHLERPSREKSISVEDLNKFQSWTIARIKQLFRDQESLQREISAVEKKLSSPSHSSTSARSSHSPSRSAGVDSASPTLETRHDLGPEEQELVRTYNAAVDGNRSEFMSQYQAKRVDVANAKDLARDPDMQPKFEESGSGDYLAVQLANLGNEEVLVVPKLGLTYGEELHQRAGMKHVFTSEGYDPQLRYRDIRLVEPAVFRSAGGGSYKLVRSGVIKLGRGE